MEKEDLQQRTNLLLAETVALGFDTKKYVNWAIELMQDDYQFEELDILAGLDENDSREVEKYFIPVTERLGINIIHDEETLLKHYVSYISHKVVSKELSPTKGQAMVTKVYYQLDYPSGFESIVYADDYWYVEGANGAKEDEYEKFLINEFRLFLEENK